MASRKEYEMMFRLNAQLGGSYNSSFKAAEAALSQMEGGIMSLNKAQSNITAYQRQQAAIEATKSKLDVLQKQYDNMQREMEETGESSAALKNKLLDKQLQIEKTTAAVGAQTSKLGQLEAALRSAGVDTQNLAGESRRLEAEYDQLQKEQQEAAEQAKVFGDEASESVSIIERALSAAGIGKAIQEIYEQFKAATEASIEFESAMTGVSKTTDLTDEEFAAMSEQIKELSTVIPIATTELANVAEVAGQLGIAKKDLLDFSTVMSMLATATTMSADEAATMLAQFANITQMDPALYSNLSSSIVDLGNNYATTEQRITEMAQGIAASGSLAGMSEADMVALSAAVTSLGIEAGNGSTQMGKLISMLMTAVETGDDLEAFSGIAGMSAEEFTQAWGSDAVGALQSFVVGLNDTERNGASAIVSLNNLGITEARMQKMILSLSTSGDLLNRTIATSNNAWTKNTALTVEAEKRYGTTESQIKLVNNAINNMRVSVGDAFTPVIKEAAEVISDVVNALAVWAEKNPEVVQCVAAVAAGVAVFAALTVGVGLAIAAFHALNAVMMANPFILVAAAIAGVATALVSFGVLAASSADDTDNLAKRSGELRDAFAETKVAYDELSSSLASEGSNVTSLVGALDAAINSSANTAAQQAVILDLVGKLNEAIPNLGLSYDSATNSLVNYTTESLQGMANSAVATEKNNAATARLSELYTEQAKISEEATAAQEKLAEQQAVAAESTESVTHRMDAYSYTVNEATVASYATQRAINDLTEAQEENAAEIASLTAETEAYAAEQEAAHGATRDLDTALSDVSGSMSDLSAAYQESYDNALKSIGGQFGLFDTLKTEVELSVSDMITAMKSQVAYMAEYSENLKAATNLGLDEGLLAQLSDGSKESAAYLDAIVASGKNGVAQLNLAFAEVENGKEAFAGTVSELEEGFTDAMDALKTELSTTIGEMNLNQEASESGKNTVQGFIDSANDMLPAVKRAYAAVAEAAVAAIEENLDIHSPSRRLYATGEMAMAGHINAVRDADQDVREAYAEAADSGVDAMAEESMRIVAMSPQLVEALSWRTAAVTESAQYIAPAGGGAPVTLYITYDLSAASDIESVKSLLREHDADLERLVRRVVANDMADQRRGAFV